MWDPRVRSSPTSSHEAPPQPPFCSSPTSPPVHTWRSASASPPLASSRYRPNRLVVPRRHPAHCFPIPDLSLCRALYPFLSRRSIGPSAPSSPVALAPGHLLLATTPAGSAPMCATAGKCTTHRLCAALLGDTLIRLLAHSDSVQSHHGIEACRQ
jgi:hypothetical protein